MMYSTYNNYYTYLKKKNSRRLTKTIYYIVLNGSFIVNVCYIVNTKLSKH